VLGMDNVSLKEYLEREFDSIGKSGDEFANQLMDKSRGMGMYKGALMFSLCLDCFRDIGTVLGGPSKSEDFSIDINPNISEEMVLSKIKKYYNSLGLEYSGQESGGYNFTGDKHIWVNFTYLDAKRIFGVNQARITVRDKTDF
jgi:hypothetical protein